MFSKNAPRGIDSPKRRPFQEAPPNQVVLQRGIAACKRGDLEAASRDLETVVLIEPKNAEALTWYGYVLLRQGKAAKAIEVLDRALLLRPNDPDTCTNLGNALLLKANRTPAETKKAVSLFERAAQIAPNSAEAQYNLGFALARVGQNERAVNAYRRATTLNPKDGRAWTNLGYALVQLGQNRQAMDALKNGVTYAPQDGMTWATLGTLQLANGDKNGGMASLENARKLDPKNKDVLMALGRAYGSVGRHAEAVDAYGAAADIAEAAPDARKDATPRYNQGVALAQAGRLNDALAAYDKVIAIDPRFYDAVVNSGYILFRQKKTDEAIDRFKAAIKINNQIPLAWTNLAAACEAKENWSGAVFAWRRASALEPTRYEYRSYMAADLIKMKRYGDAITAYKQAAETWPTLAEPYIELGKVYELHGSEAADAAAKGKWVMLAQNAYAQALKREPDNTEARENVRRLREANPPPPPAAPTPAAPASGAGTTVPPATGTTAKPPAPATNPAKPTPTPTPTPGNAAPVPAPANPPGATPAPAKKPVRRRRYYRRATPTPPPVQIGPNGVPTVPTPLLHPPTTAGKPTLPPTKPSGKPATKPVVRRKPSVQPAPPKNTGGTAGQTPL